MMTKEQIYYALTRVEEIYVMRSNRGDNLQELKKHRTRTTDEIMFGEAEYMVDTLSNFEGDE